MALDSDLEIYDATVNANSNGFNVQSNWLSLGRVGLPNGAQFYVSVETYNADRALTVALERTLDNNSASLQEITKFVIPVNFEGVWVRGIAEDFNVQEYADANVDVRVNITADNHANASNFGAVKAYLAHGEKASHGRQVGADTLEL